MKEHVYSAAVYLRLSKEDGDLDGRMKSESNSICSQRELVRSFIKEQDDMELFDIYTEGKAAYLIQSKEIPMPRAHGATRYKKVPDIALFHSNIFDAVQNHLSVYDRFPIPHNSICAAAEF